MSKGRIEKTYFDKKTRATYKLVHQIQIKFMDGYWSDFNEIDLSRELKIQSRMLFRSLERRPTIMEGIKFWENFRNCRSSYNSYRVNTELYKLKDGQWVPEDF